MILRSLRLAATIGALSLSLSLSPALAGGDEIFSDGFESRNTLAWSAQQPPLPAPTVHRMSDLDLRDPHVFVDLPIFGCSDITESDPLGSGSGFNEQLQTAITTDGDDDDSNLDLSYLLAFRPLMVLAIDERLDIGQGVCPAPSPPSTCDWLIPPVPQTVDYTGEAAGLCLEPVPGTTGGYSPAIVSPSGPCFASSAATMILAAIGVEIPIQAAQLGAAFVGGDPPSALGDGLWLGFLRESDADSILLPAGLPVVGGQPLSILFPGGAGNCAAQDDRDEGPDLESGWWLYFNFPASPITFTGR